MKNKTNRKSTYTFISVLAVLLSFTAIASVMTGCGSSSSSNAIEASSSIEETTSNNDVTSNADSSSDANGSESQNQDSNASSNANNANLSSNSESSGASTSSNSTSSKSPSKNSSSSKSDSNSNNNASGVLSVDGNKYKVGDTFTCTVKLTTPDIIENFEGTIQYDSNYLLVSDAKLVGEADNGGYINPKHKKGIIFFNGVSIMDGFNYTKGDNIISVTYKVLKAGNTSPSVNWDVMTQKKVQNGTPYVQDGKPANGMKYSVVYS